MPVSDSDLVPSEWSDGEPMTVEEWGRREFDSGYKTGYIRGLEASVNYLKATAGALFSSGKDAEAAVARKLADSVAVLIK